MDGPMIRPIVRAGRCSEVVDGMNPTLIALLEQLRLIPIMTIRDALHAAPLADALAAGGLPCAEITLRTADALKAIRVFREKREMLVGAGTVLEVDQVKAAVDAGAEFVVSPGFGTKVVGYCLDHGIPIAPGVATATDIALALDHGLSVVKFFPAESLGGVHALKALGAAYRMMRFIPTGGIVPGCVRDYLALPQVVACGGSWLAAESLYSGGNYEAVTHVVREAVTLVES